jgi:hypothetical protein
MWRDLLDGIRRAEFSADGSRIYSLDVRTLLDLPFLAGSGEEVVLMRRSHNCAPPLASIPTVHRGSPRMKLSICAGRNCRRITTRPLPSAPLTANALFAKSIRSL